MSTNEAQFPEGLAVQYHRYERALFANDARLLNSFFIPEASTVRYGIADVQNGYDEIVAHHQSQAIRDRRFISHDLACLEPAAGVAVLTTTFTRQSDQQTGRQTQVWVRGADQVWRIAHAHVSMAPIGRPD